MLTPQTLRPLTIINPCFFLLHLSGLSPIKPYLVHVFQGGETASWATVTRIKHAYSSKAGKFITGFFIRAEIFSSFPKETALDHTLGRFDTLQTLTSHL
jgi:hypothetical protein